MDIELLRKIGVLEEELHKTRRQIVLEEAELTRLEKRLFSAEQKQNRSLRQTLTALERVQMETETETKAIKQKSQSRLKTLSKQNRAQEIQNAVWEHKMLQNELQSLQQNYSKMLKKAANK